MFAIPPPFSHNEARKADHFSLEAREKEMFSIPAKVLILLVANLPLYCFIGRKFFPDRQSFWQALRSSFLPDLGGYFTGNPENLAHEFRFTGCILSILAALALEFYAFGLI